jgi:hypothetical protein
MSIFALTSETLSNPAAAGQIEYTSPIFAGTPIGTQRGIVPTQQYYRLDSAFVGSNVATAQSIFNVGCTLSASTVYEFEMVVAVSKSAGTTSHTFGVGFGGTASVNNIGYRLNVQNPSGTSFTVVAIADYAMFVQTASNTTITGAQSSAALFLSFAIKGTVSVNAGGTFIPQYTLSAAPGGAYSTNIGSYIRINPLSASGAATNVGTWA